MERSEEGEGRKRACALEQRPRRGTAACVVMGLQGALRNEDLWILRDPPAHRLRAARVITLL